MKYIINSLFCVDPEFVNSNKRNERVISCIGRLRPPRPEQGILLDMPYRLVYAVATNDSILIGDTASTEPLACIKNIHCTRMTDISWSPDGLVLVASSTDGFCSILTFEEGELGARFKVEGEGAEFPTLTPTCFPIAPPEPKPVRKKQPKELKEPKEPKEKPEPKEKKESKEKKEPKEKKEKEPVTPIENKEEKKKKSLTILKMFSNAKNSPSSSLNTPTTPAAKSIEQSIAIAPQTPVDSSSSPANPTPSKEATTPKPTLLESWIKKTPKSANSEAKTPRRISLITLKPSDKAKSEGASASAATPDGGNVKQNEKTSVKSGPEQKTPRRVQFITLSKPNPGQEVSSSATSNTTTAPLIPNTSTSTDGSSSSVTAVPSTDSPKPESRKQPRRVEIITLDEDNEPKPKRRAIEVS